MTRMMDTAGPAILELEGIGKTYRRRGADVRAVDGISLTVTRGEVYGFLGPNGAGKSTTIRMALGLIAPTAGTVRLFGHDLARDRGPLRRVGSLADGGSFYPHLSGRDNLRILGKTMGLVDPPIDILLERVDLAAGGRRKVKEYSLGMKQRLGVAAALLNDPELVILDEPTNGLDAAGIRDMRSLIRSLAADGKAVFLSSHLLHEVQQLCDRVAIVARGRLVREAPIGDLLAAGRRSIVEVGDAVAAAALLGGSWPCHPTDGHVEIDVPREDLPAVVRRLVEAGIDVYAVHAKQENLESIFLEMTGDQND